MAAGRVKRLVAANWRNAVLVCGKCSGKLDGGFGDKHRQSLTKMLRRELDGGKGRKTGIGVVEVKCLGICPKGAVTVVDTARPGEWRLIRPGDDLAPLAAEIRGATIAAS